MTEGKKLFDELKNLITESRNENTLNIDACSIKEKLVLINNEDKNITQIVKREIPYIVNGVKIIQSVFENGGRLFYIGSGTSGRLGVLDAAECPPTFGADPEMVQGVISGGIKALYRSVEGEEDKLNQGTKDLLERGFSKNDVLCGIAASGRTPYVIGAMKAAKEMGAKTIYITCSPREYLKIDPDVAICPVVGPEVVMGSTRMKAGTATKMILNMLTTCSMIGIGKVYENMMVDLMATNKKLEERSKKTVMIVTGVSYDQAERYLILSKGSVKTAIVMILADVTFVEAERRLNNSNGHVREALGARLE